MQNLQLTELICTRISHDLIGNIGAVSNAVELFEDDPESIEEIKPILYLSSKILSARLKFFRLAFGLSNTSLNSIEEIKTITDNYIKTIGNPNNPIMLNFDIKTPALYKIIMLSTMCLADTFIKGGNIDVIETGNEITFKAKSEHILSANKLQALQNFIKTKTTNENPAQLAPMAYLQNMLFKTDVNISLNFNEFEAVLQIG